MMNTEIQATTIEQFTQIVYQSATKRYAHFSNASPEKELIDKEIEVFSSIPGYLDYLLVLKGLVEAVKANGIPVGPGYGASPASIVAYCLGITGIDPVGNDSRFEQFAEKGQTTFPAITLEFGGRGVAFAYKYLQDTLGAGKVARLMIAPGFLTCTHIVFSLGELQEIVPVYLEESEGDSFSTVRKYDLRRNCKGQAFLVTVLVNWHLDEIGTSLELIERHHHIEIRPEDIPLDDEDTFALFSSGDTACIPYYDVKRVQMYLKELHPCGFKDLMAILEDAHGSLPFRVHCICRTLTSYRMASIKAHYRNEFHMARMIIARRRRKVNMESEDPFRFKF